MLFLSNIEPNNVNETLADSDWVIAMQEELHQFERNKVSWLTKKASQVWLTFLDPIWYLEQPRNNTLLPCPQQKLNMLQLLLVVLNHCG